MTEAANHLENARNLREQSEPPLGEGAALGWVASADPDTPASTVDPSGTREASMKAPKIAWVTHGRDWLIANLSNQVNGYGGDEVSHLVNHWKAKSLNLFEDVK